MSALVISGAPVLCFAFLEHTPYVAFHFVLKDVITSNISALSAYTNLESLASDKEIICFLIFK